jgi:hypothetical protein
LFYRFDSSQGNFDHSCFLRRKSDFRNNENILVE